MARTRDWLRYEVPDHFIRRESRGHYKGQKQIWFLLQLLGRDSDVDLRATNHPEFDAWRWNDYWVPLDVVIEFKRGVYQLALNELSRFVPKGHGHREHRDARHGHGHGHGEARQGEGRHARHGEPEGSSRPDAPAAEPSAPAATPAENPAATPAATPTENPAATPVTPVAETPWRNARVRAQ